MPRSRRTGRIIALTAAAAALGAAAWSFRDVPAALGRRPRRERLARLADSPQFHDGAFHNADGLGAATITSIGSVLADRRANTAPTKPLRPVPLALPDPDPGPGAHVTWYGHASALVDMDGARFLLDPVWSDRCSPSRLTGPRRLHPVPVELADVPHVDAVLISHDHYDHLDMPTVKAITRERTAPFLVPLGIGEHLERWGVPPERIIELDWDESHTVAGVTLTLTAAQHFSGRGFKRNTSLWGSWVLAGSGHRFFYTGDSGYFDGYRAIGQEYGPFDATLVQIGAYSPSWPHIHMTPEEAAQAHLDLRGGLLIPVHWCTFDLAFHAWGEPVDRLWREAKARGIALTIPRPGQTVDIAAAPEPDGWWQGLA
ncbi:MBL fold metallo-hydrolase [Phytomonospora endophytica]|uniref:L-ascorbate metabolism protein UlaG (Beta-lactamase superfamily) n=1 Tax=Phytomonospora endophytica TaxID=714109 RepID=A0A841FLQ6_9ACTN|nr:MBL fold metallo-hydrolase [Phytomonospora endophytica]MBB6035853.1 L-ascorbate metabolism protein UlaG (beta-lactamase superfamily) [Phytomonospora endophytica]GIG71532.1 Zn-dependent hydrolase [Phytomonospora endophytica]